MDSWGLEAQRHQAPPSTLEPEGSEPAPIIPRAPEHYSQQCIQIPPSRKNTNRCRKP